MNERITENIVRNLLREKGYYDDGNIIIEEQQSQNPKITKLLKGASKSGDGAGYPEFIITFKNKPEDLIVIECKKSVLFHESKDRNNPKDYAVDGVLLYASYLQKDYNVTAIAVSGTNDKDKKISTFLWLRGNYTYKDIQDKIFLKSTEIENIIKEQSKPFDEATLVAKAIEYNSFLHNYSIPEVERCTLISAILIALQNEPFLKSYKYYTSNKKLIEALLSACESVLEQNKLDIQKRQVIISEYSKFENNTDFNSNTIYNKKTRKDEINTTLRDFISSINQEILPHINESKFDVLGKFYTQFIRYAGSDKKTGLVLTPTHITDLFCDIANLSVDEIVFDPCCGTAGFLVSAMNYMLKKAGNDTKKQSEIKTNQLIGIEKRADMFSHACSNMMMRGDGKSHILYGSCFDDKNKNIVKDEFKPTKGFLNPPYQDGNADEQLEFVENTLECLVKDGICIAICQMSIATSDNKKVQLVKSRLLEKHTLEAVFSMPADLFSPVAVNTVIIVFKAHNPHPDNKKTFFGYFRDDGFVKTKNNGRIDKDNKFENIKREWLEAYLNRENIPGLSINAIVKANDEWSAETYLETDYSKVTDSQFIKKMLDYSTFLYSNRFKDFVSNKKLNSKKIKLNTNNWEYFDLHRLFDVISTTDPLINTLISGGKTPYIASSESNNGVIDFVEEETNFGANTITANRGGSVGYFFYQPVNYLATPVDVRILKPKFELNPFIGIFLITIFEMEKYRYNYSRKMGTDRLNNFKVKLPAVLKGGEYEPDFDFMEKYIKSLPYSSSI